MEDGAPSPWWTVLQALVWIVTRSDQAVIRANGLRTLASLRRLTWGVPPPGHAEPPISPSAATHELIRAWRARRVAIHGREGGTGSSRPVPPRNDRHLRDYRGEACLGLKTLYFNSHPFWAGLMLQADDCRRCWPAPVRPVVRTPRKSPAARAPTAAEVLASIEENRRALRAERKRAGRDVLLKAAMDHFGLSRKVALEIWNSAPRDRKGGRPKRS